MLYGLEVKINNGLRKWGTSVVITFYRKYGLTVIRLCYFKNDLVINIPTRKQHVSRSMTILPMQIVNVGYG
jgi:hypothetical protein